MCRRFALRSSYSSNSAKPVTNDQQRLMCRQEPRAERRACGCEAVPGDSARSQAAEESADSGAGDDGGEAVRGGDSAGAEALQEEGEAVITDRLLFDFVLEIARVAECL